MIFSFLLIICHLTCLAFVFSKLEILSNLIVNHNLLIVFSLFSVMDFAELETDAINKENN